MLNIDRLHKSFGGLQVLTDVTFDVKAGRILGLIGPNGAGKTTLFNVVTGFLRPSSGEIRFDGTTITNISPERRSRLGMARTFQIVKPFPGLTVIENVVVAAFQGRTNRQTEARRIGQEMLDRVGLKNRMQELASHLTVSDRKRLELARCLATAPRLLLLDEVMSGLNPTEMTSMIELVQVLRNEGLTIILVEHIMDAVARLADDVIVLSGGEILARGTPESVLVDEAVIEAYLGEQFSIAEG